MDHRSAWFAAFPANNFIGACMIRRVTMRLLGLFPAVFLKVDAKRNEKRPDHIEKPFNMPLGFF